MDWNTDRRTRNGSVMLAAAALALIAGQARAQNLIRNASFEHGNLDIVNWADFVNGVHTVVGFDNTQIDPWVVPAGADAELYYPRLDTLKSITRVPHRDCVLGLDFDHPSVGIVEQSFSTGYTQSGMYMMCADMAGDRGKFPTLPAIASLGSSLRISTGTQVNRWSYFNTPDVHGPNTTQESYFFPRVQPFTALGPGAGISGKFTMWDNTDRGVLVDAVHLFPLYVNDLYCDASRWKELAGFSILEHGTWAASPVNLVDPWTHLRNSTLAGCSCGPDSKKIVMNSGLGGASTMLVAAWDPGVPRTTLHLKIEASAMGNSCAPQFWVSFYEWTKKQWARASIMSLVFPGSKLSTSSICYEVRWENIKVVPFGAQPPMGNYVSSPVSDGSFGPMNVVLARIVFDNGNGSFAQSYPPPPAQPWTIDVNYVAIE